MPLTKAMHKRNPNEANRTASTLELLFDLVYVIAVSAAAEGLHHRLSEHDFSGFITFTVAFFILWNAWTSFTWFASGYDPDDVPYRISVMLTMLGSLLIAANLHQFFEQGLMWIGVVGYIIIRLASCSQWWRVYKDISSDRKVAKRSIIGLIVLQSMWISWLFLPTTIQTPALFVFIVAELLMPIWARSEHYDNWHPQHLAERYGLLTIIVLGEGILGVSTTIHELLTTATQSVNSIIFLGSGLLALLFSLWWLYFTIPFDKILEGERRRQDLVIFGYGHFFVFASLAGLGSALNLVPEALKSQSHINVVLHDAAHAVSELYAICMIMGQLAAFLLILTILRSTMCQKSSQNLKAILSAFAIIALCVFIVTQGIPLVYAVWLSVLAPTAMILCFEKDNAHWKN